MSVFCCWEEVLLRADRNPGAGGAATEGPISVPIWKKDAASGFAPSSRQLEAAVSRGAE